MPTAMNKQIEHYLRTGEYDQDYLAWPGENFFARARHGHAALRTDIPRPFSQSSNFSGLFFHDHFLRKT
jgi:hypothetical protein